MMNWIVWVVVMIMTLGTDKSAEIIGNAPVASYYAASPNASLPIASLVQNPWEEGFGGFFETSQQSGPVNFPCSLVYFQPEYRSKLSPLVICDSEYQIQNHMYPFHGFL